MLPLLLLLLSKQKSPQKLIFIIKGKNELGDLAQAFTEAGTTHDIMVLGLYADYSNTVRVTFYIEKDVEIGTKEYTIETDPLIAALPKIQIDVAKPSEMAEGWTFVSYYGRKVGGNNHPPRPFIFDGNGDIRWYLDLRNHPSLGSSLYDNGMERLFNGNLYFGDRSTNIIYEMDILGNIINSWDVGVFGYGFHHQVLKKQNGNYIFTATKLEDSTEEDFVVEINRSTGLIENTWDFKESMEYGRHAWPSNAQPLDWFHGNTLVHDQNDNSIVVSGRTQGVVKFNNANEVVWIMAPHRDWRTSGNDIDLYQFLLQPLDANNQPITDESVLDGSANHPDFEWNWYQHAPQLLPNGNIMLFDNGDNRNYVRAGPYSRAVEFEIDEENMTIKQVWQYGKERGFETYSRIVSDIDFYPEENHVFFSPGAIINREAHGKIVEIDYATKEVLFEATITPPQAAWGLVTFHRTERMSIYPFPNPVLIAVE